MSIFQEYLSKIEASEIRARTEEILTWVSDTFPELAPRVAWNQPMFTHHGTFIIGFSVSKKHLAVSPEQAGMLHFADEIRQAGYDLSKMLFRIRWNDPVDYSLLSRIIAFNIQDKAGCSTFWRK